jgi:putative transposase
VVFNDVVAARKRAFTEGLPYPTKAMLSKALITEAKRTPERAWLAEVSTAALQQALADADRAYRSFFDSLAGKRPRGRVGPPRFKKRTNTQSARFARNAKFRVLGNGQLRLPKIGDLKVAWSRELPTDPSSVTVIKTPTGKYYASFVVAVDDEARTLEPLSDPESESGIDLGLTDFAVLRGGKVIENPRFFKRLERKLKKAQRAFSRKVKGSANRAKARLKVARVHEQVKHKRLDWIDKQVATIVAENQGIYVENLNVQGLARGRAAKSWHDAAAGMFLVRLESKAAQTGRTFVRVDQYFPSTQLCSSCGALTGPKGFEGLKVRKWVCLCGAVHDRDVNAEINIRREGKRLVAAGQADT